MQVIFPGVTNETYDLYTLHYKPIFDVRYHLDVPLDVHPFMQCQQNLIFAYEDSGEYIGGSNILFLEDHFHEGILKGDIIDDMILSLNDVKSHTRGDRLNVYVSSIYVREPWRGQGVSESILKLVETFAREQVASEVELLAVCISEASVKLFQKMGYCHLGVNAAGDHLLHLVLRK